MSDIKKIIIKCGVENYSSHAAFLFRCQFYQNVSTTPSKSDYYPMFFELVARAIFFNITKHTAFTHKKQQNDFYVKRRKH